MKVMMLAAGAGRRMRPLTKHTAKPLIKVGQHSLIEHNIRSLQQQGLTDIIINVHYFADKIQQTLGDGSNYGVNIRYSVETEQPLGAAGGIIKALPLLGPEPFLLLSADIFCDYNFAALQTINTQTAHLVMVDNPAYNPSGDFALEQGFLSFNPHNKLTYANIGLYSPHLFRNLDLIPTPLLPIIRPYIEAKKITGDYFSGNWHNVGSIEILKQLRQKINVAENTH
jgi:N-acetyl-alpha-D-muramate 1-phosphate uridylyltransferase